MPSSIKRKHLITKSIVVVHLFGEGFIYYVGKRTLNRIRIRSRLVLVFSLLEDEEDEMFQGPGHNMYAWLHFGAAFPTAAAGSLRTMDHIFYPKFCLNPPPNMKPPTCPIIRLALT